MKRDDEGGCVTYSQYTRFAHIIEMRHTVYMPMNLYIAGKNLARAVASDDEIMGALAALRQEIYPITERREASSAIKLEKYHEESGEI